jgi:hypothetical protein
MSIRKEGGQRRIEGDQPRDFDGECDSVFNHLRFVYIDAVTAPVVFDLTLSS